MSTAAWTTVCSASADDFLWLVLLKEEPFRGRPNYKHDWPSKFALKPLTGQGITTAAYFIFSLLLA